ncbi:MAG: hypothetical protein EBZ51_08235 [Synechococcaceae bacterium WB9_2_112]|nr:hypothetical protein [Synechococcaceae bacterium WB9_2_112]
MQASWHLGQIQLQGAAALHGDLGLTDAGIGAGQAQASTQQAGLTTDRLELAGGSSQIGGELQGYARQQGVGPQVARFGVAVKHHLTVASVDH